jgi:transcriptional regulator with XRE-family HTH domain
MTKHHDIILKAFGQRVRFLRQQKNFSQETLAELAGIDRTYIGGVERGERNISLLNVKRVADAFGITISELFDDEFKF